MPEAKLPMRAGEKLGRIPNKPAAIVIKDGPRTYLWVGNDAPDDMMCFATMSGEATLRKLAQAILSGLDTKHRVRKSSRQPLMPC